MVLPGLATLFLRKIITIELVSTELYFVPIYTLVFAKRHIHFKDIE